jgi:BirA family biotin operon repressor/biotin-[acetyl-CoA-carboxylase] ligase
MPGVRRWLRFGRAGGRQAPVSHLAGTPVRVAGGTIAAIPIRSDMRPTPVSEVPLSAAQRAGFAAPLRAALIVRSAHGVLAADAVTSVMETGSTQADLLSLVRVRQPQGPLLRVAIVQTAGRGRQGRRWHAAPGAGLQFSLACPMAQPNVPPALTLAAGVALADALVDVAPDVRLKWPNDLLLAQRKLGGVLAELATDREGRRTLVIGVGINLWIDAAARDAIGQPVASLVECVAPDRLLALRETLLGRVAAALAHAIDDCAARGFVPWQARFMQRFALLGQPVQILDQGTRVADGRALGVDGDGRLLIDTGERTLAFAHGDVSLRPAAALTEAP